MKVAINETTLTAIGDAIREMTGKSDLIAPAAMPTEIRGIETGGGGSGEFEPVVLTGDCQYGMAGGAGTILIERFGDKITTNNITNANYMFVYYKGETIPFDINFNTTDGATSVTQMFSSSNITSIPKITGKLNSAASFFYSAQNIRNFPEDLGSWFSYTNGMSANAAFNQCYSLRTYPISFVNKIAYYSSGISAYSSYLYNCFNCCYALDEICDLPLPYTGSGYTYDSNYFFGTFSYCNRIKELTFKKLDSGNPVTIKMKNQVIDLTYDIGYGHSSHLTYNNSGITADKEVNDDATYQALKNNPDWFATKIEYSRYNHDSAVNTINSLPDTSAYGTNTIKFKGAAGSLTDGGAINTLTEEEIAVAAAKGWTVTLI